MRHVVAAGEDRADSPVVALNGRFDCKVSAAETDGALAIFDTIRTAPGGPPVHYHLAQEEWFHVVEGQFAFQLGDERLRLGPGDSLLGPRGIPHGFRSLTPTARLLIVFQPAGTMEQFFREAGPSGALSPDAFAELSRRHGMEVVGPPLPAGEG
jgi:mannose-6-phosphate isomerase-like protein (cupin superfamily)